MRADADRLADTLWSSIQPVLFEFAEHVVEADRAITPIMGKTSNDVFLLRAYLSLRQAPIDEEVSVTVDAILSGHAVLLSADVGFDDGQLIAEGPTACVSLALDEGDLHAWLTRLKFFLASVEEKVKRLLLQS